ncbi:MAG: TetR/AcrR family transcriptional regulator [Tetrasphaera sp.]
MPTSAPVREPGRGQRLPRLQRRAQLLRAAQEVFVEKGYHASGMEDIAERAGVSKPVLYQHFPGKLELYLALVDQHTATLVDLVRAALDSTEDHRERTFASITAYFDFVDRDDAAYRLVFESDLSEVAAVRERLQWCQAECANAIAQRIVIDTGMPLPVARMAAQGLTGLSQISARAWLSDPALSRADAIRVIGQLAWKGVGGYPARPATPPE